MIRSVRAWCGIKRRGRFPELAACGMGAVYPHMRAVVRMAYAWAANTNRAAVYVLGLAAMRLFLTWGYSLRRNRVCFMRETWVADIQQLIEDRGAPRSREWTFDATAIFGFVIQFRFSLFTRDESPDTSRIKRLNEKISIQ